MTAPFSFAEEVWTTLSSVDASDRVEYKTGGGRKLAYLSWAWAWGILMEYFPESELADVYNTTDDAGTVMVTATITVKRGDASLTRKMWLPVMDHKNAAIVSPDARDVSDTRMRCMVKCLALFGLGHYLYAGEDLPTAAVEKVEYISEADTAWALQVLADTGSTEEAFMAWVRATKMAHETAEHVRDIPLKSWHRAKAALDAKLLAYAKHYAESAEAPKGE